MQGTARTGEWKDSCIVAWSDHAADGTVDAGNPALFECEDARRWRRIARWAASLALSGAACVGMAAAANEVVRPVRQDAKTSQQTETRNADLSILDEVEKSCWTNIASKRVYFAHQHRGEELVLGLQDILASHPSIGLHVRAQSSFTAGEQLFAKPAFVHGPAGADGEPERKIDRFVAFLRSGEGTHVDLAVLDFSMNDFDRSTDPEKLFEHHQKAIETLERERPTLQVFAATVPLACPEQGVRERMRRMMGTTGNIANAVRGRFNDLIRAEFGNERTIDFAHAESERPDMTHCSVIVGGVRWPARCTESVVEHEKSTKLERNNNKREEGDAAKSKRTTAETSPRQGHETLTRAARQALAREMLVAFARTCEGTPATTSAVGTD